MGFIAVAAVSRMLGHTIPGTKTITDTMGFQDNPSYRHATRERHEMPKDPFSSSSGGAQLKANVGRLALLRPQEFVPNAVDGKFGKVDGVRTNVVFLDDGPEPDDALDAEDAEQNDGMIIINGPVVKELKPLLPVPAEVSNGVVITKAKDGGMLLGRVAQVPNKKGNEPVIVLNAPDPSDKVKARNYLAYLAKDDDPFA